MGLEQSRAEAPCCLWPRSALSLALWLLLLSTATGAASAPLWWPQRRYFCCHNDGAAFGQTRTISTAQSFYHDADRDQNGVFDYGSLTELGNTQLVDAVLSAGVKQGYRFQVVTLAGGRTWWAAADPYIPGQTGSVFYYTNHSRVIYATDEGPIRPRPGSPDLLPDRGLDVAVKSARDWWE